MVLPSLMSRATSDLLAVRMIVAAALMYAVNTLFGIAFQAFHLSLHAIFNLIYGCRVLCRIRVARLGFVSICIHPLTSFVRSCKPSTIHGLIACVAGSNQPDASNRDVINCRYLLSVDR